MTLYGPSGEALAPSRARASAYQGASRTHTDLAAWTPRRYSAQGALSADRDLLVARAQDLARNDGWASAGLSRLVDNIIGAGWRLNAALNARRLGLSEDEAAELSAQIEAAFEEWANDPDNGCDAERRSNLGGLMALAYRHRAGDGEALGVISYARGRGPWGTFLQVVDPDRLGTPPGGLETAMLKDGVELGPHGEPVAYWIRREHPSDAYPAYNAEFTRVPRFHAGRRLVVHAFEAQRAGQVRGVSALAAIVKKLRMMGRYDEAELQAAVLNSTLAAFVTAPMDHAAVAEALAGGETTRFQEQYLDLKSQYWADAPLPQQGVKLNFLYPGEEVEMKAAEHPSGAFEAFTRAGLRNIASAVGLTYEQLSADWGEVNYSSARAALLEVWRGFTARAGAFAHQFVLPVYVRWLEEAVARGRVVLPASGPSFAEAKSAWTRSRWLMPGRGWVDPMKEAEAARERIALGISTLEREAGEQGSDWEEVLAQRGRELARARDIETEHGLPPNTLLPPARAQGGAPGQSGPQPKDE